MRLRRGALADAEEVVTLIEQLDRRYRRRTVATVGRIDVRPNNITTLPGEVEHYLDIRDIDELHRQETVLAGEGIPRIAERRDLGHRLELIAHTMPAHLWSWGGSCPGGLRRRRRALPSGASHHAQIIACRFPTRCSSCRARMERVTSRGSGPSPARWRLRSRSSSERWIARTHRGIRRTDRIRP